jgi:DNA mismatch endonuclease, patch repair protein
MNLCMCGCNKIVNKNRKYIKGHQNRGRLHSPETKDIIKNNSKNRKWINKNGKDLLVKINKLKNFLNDGWIIGRLSGHNEITINKSRETKKRKFKTGEIEIWNKGLKKETDKRVKNNGEKIGVSLIQNYKDGKFLHWTNKKPKIKVKKIYSIISKKNKISRLSQIIPSKDTSIEIKLQKILKKNKILFQKHKSIFGQPDIFIQPNICIFADGCYWHKYPKGTNRDKKVNEYLKQNGYIVLRFWEHEINNDIERCFQIINLEIIKYLIKVA